MRHFLLPIALIVLVCGVPDRARAAPIARRYVKWVGIGGESGSGTGTSWCNAYSSLQLALVWANSPNPTGEEREIWMTYGVFKPERLPSPNEDEPYCYLSNTPTNAPSFCITRPVKIYGGFDGTETLLEQRTVGVPGVNVTCLSGDINGDDVGEPFDPTTNQTTVYADTWDDNPQSVVTVVGYTSPTMDRNNTFLDGLSIKYGFNRNTDALGGGGGVLFASGGGATFRNCTIASNYALQGGGGIYSPGVLDSHFVDCVIANNKANHGGAMASKALGDNLRIANCEVTENVSYDQGGALFLASGGSGQVHITNSVFARNFAAGAIDLGGAMFIEAVGNGPDSGCKIFNTVFTGNVAGSGGGIAVTKSTVSIVNSIAWANTASNKRQIYVFGGQPSTVTVSSSDVERWRSDGNDVTSGSQLVFAGTGNLGTLQSHDPSFLNTTGPYYLDYNYRLAPGSPCADRGDNSLLPLDETDVDADGNTTESLPRDFDRLSRIDDDLAAANPEPPPVASCGTVDMGAFETSSQSPSALAPSPEPSGVSKSRFISFVPAEGTWLLRVDFVSLNHPYPTGNASTADLRAAEGHFLWVGVPRTVVHGNVTYVVAPLSCVPYGGPWNTNDVLHVYGPEIGPDSVYDVRAVTCLSIGGNDLAPFENSQTAFSAPLRLTTGRWADVTAPRFGTGCVSREPSFMDISAVVGAFQGLIGAIPYTSAKLVNGVVPSGSGPPFVPGQMVDPDDPVNFLDVSTVVAAFKGKVFPYDYATQCP